MEKNYIKLELDKIIEILTNYCLTNVGKSYIKKLLPSNEKSTVIILQNETKEACTLINRGGQAPFYPIFDFKTVKKALDSDIALSCKSLKEVANILKCSYELKNYFTSNVDSTVQSELSKYFDLLYSNKDIENQILSSIQDDENISDDASPALRNIRRKIRSLESNIKERLNHIIHSSSYAKYIMEPIVTIRNNRYVIPVKVEFKDSIKGFIHDFSFSGATVFIEPVSIFDLNNEIHNLQIEENIEIERILKLLTKLVTSHAEQILVSYETIGQLDSIFAKAKYSINNNCSAPIINNEKYIKLLNARHPLIDKSSVVPIDIYIGKSYNALIITGPNTGGKTVSLKTTGLLCLMAYIGLQIPADDGSSICVFDKIFADIGDEQSIQESLSTFSSHMSNIVEICNTFSSNSLILIDELGSGTDPIQGANLAISILDYLKNGDALILATTHYQELKNYALVTNGYENASSEFDIETLQPTYKLLIGVPGKSNAFAISKRLGIPSEILERAESLMNNDHLSVEDLIKEIYNDKLEIEKELEKTKKNSAQIKLIKLQLEQQKKQLENMQNEKIEKAKIEARDLLYNAKKEANEIISKLNKINNNLNDSSLKKANELRNQLNKSLSALATTPIATMENQDSTLASEKITVGMEVFVNNLNQPATIISLPDKSGNLRIQVGNLKMTSNIKNLSALPNKSTKKVASTTTYASTLKTKKATTEINVIGQNIEEATFVIDKFLDNSALANLKTVRIVHGKGTGKLRKGIHAFLSKNPHVKDFRVGTFGEGEMGVTIVNLK